MREHTCKELPREAQTRDAFAFWRGFFTLEATCWHFYFSSLKFHFKSSWLEFQSEKEMIFSLLFIVLYFSANVGEMWWNTRAHTSFSLCSHQPSSKVKEESANMLWTILNSFLSFFSLFPVCLFTRKLSFQLSHIDFTLSTSMLAYCLRNSL